MGPAFQTKSGDFVLFQQLRFLLQEARVTGGGDGRFSGDSQLSGKLGTRSLSPAYRATGLPPALGPGQTGEGCEDSEPVGAL